jgi:hypothetical protein
LKPNTRIEVEWIDSLSDDKYWQSTTNFDFKARDDEMHFLTVGYFVKKTATAIHLAQSVGKNGQIGGVFSIPNVAVKKVRRIK